MRKYNPYDTSSRTSLDHRLTYNLGGAWDRTVVAKCLDVNLLAYATGGIAVGFDIIILLLPIPQLVKLKMNMRKKLNVLFMFSLGSMYVTLPRSHVFLHVAATLPVYYIADKDFSACVTSMVRLKYLAEFAKTTDASYDNTIPVLWSILEISIAIICACLPALRALFSHYLPRVFPNMSTHGGNSQYHQHEASSNSHVKGSAVNSTTISSISSKSKGFMSPTTTIVEKSVQSPLGQDKNWGSVNNAITRNQEVVQDVERGTKPLPPVFDNGIQRNTTVTTKIWVDNSPTDTAFRSPQGTSPKREDDPSKRHHHGHHPLKSHSIEHKINESGVKTAYHPHNNESQDTMTMSQSQTKFYHHDRAVSAQMSRHGSEDSIFALEGPRESDDEQESMMERGRQQRHLDGEREEFEMSEIESSGRTATFGRRDGSAGQSRSRSGSLRGRGWVPVSVFNQNPSLRS